MRPFTGVHERDRIPWALSLTGPEAGALRRVTDRVSIRPLGSHRRLHRLASLRVARDRIQLRDVRGLEGMPDVLLLRLPGL